MRVDISPEHVLVSPGSPVVVTVSVTNTGDVISGHLVRVLGVDPRWVQLSEERLSLFPGAVGVCIITLSLPTSLLAGQRRLSIQVRELTGSGSTEVHDVDLDLPEVHSVQSRIEPGSLTTGRRGSFSMVIENTGNSVVNGELAGADEEDRVRYRFSPPSLTVAPGEHAVVDVDVRARRRLFGTLTVRPFTVRVRQPGPELDETFGAANATLLQKPVIGRAALSMLGLLAAVSVFALVITYALSGVVGRSASDRDLALQVAQAQQPSVAGNGTLSGTVRLLTSGQAVPGVTVELFAASDAANPLTSLATDSTGAYKLTGIAAGSYKLRFRGAGFSELWYPQGLTDADATTIDLQAGATKAALDVRLGGLPASIEGTVSGGDPTGAIVTLLVPGTASTSSSGGSVSSVTTSGGLPDGAAAVRTVKVGSDGSFSLANVPSPSVYDLAVDKPGFASVVERVDVGGGEHRSGLQIRLLKGDGVISGTVSDRSGALPNATISAQYGTTTVRTTSLTEKGKEGTFTLRGLPTPGSVTVVVAAPDHASQTLALSLTAGQHLTGVAVTLGGASGSLGGVATLVDTSPSSGATPAPPANQPATGVTVVVTNGALTLQTVTSSVGTPGAWSVTGLPLPNTYTVTFSRADLAPQTLAVSLDQFGAVSGGTQSADHVDTALRSATLNVTGQTLQQALDGTRTPVGEVQVSISSGSSTYVVSSTSVPAANRGRFEVDKLAPGTYTITATRRGTRPSSQIVDLQLGVAPTPLTLVLAAPASVSGTVRDADGSPFQHAEVRLFLVSSYPASSQQTTLTDELGHYQFDDVAAPEQYVVEYDYPPGSTPSASKTFTLTESQQATVDLRAPAPGTR